MQSPMGIPSAVGGCRYFSGRPGGPTDEKRGGAEEDGAKAPYRFIEEQGGSVRSAGQSKVGYFLSSGRLCS